MIRSVRGVPSRVDAPTAYTRRTMLRGSVATLSAALCPLAAGQTPLPAIPGKPGLKVLSERPINAETPAHLLDDAVTPAERMFVRNNGIPPDTSAIDPLAWTVELAGESCVRPTKLTLRELKERFEHVTLQLQVECGGNGRSEFHPPARGNQWTTGAVACPRWTGVRLKDVLDHLRRNRRGCLRGLRSRRHAPVRGSHETADLARRADAKGP